MKKDKGTLQETQRLAIQAELDGNRSSRVRNTLGQFATPTELAREIVSYGLELLPADQPLRFLDPALGTGSFFSALLATCGTRKIEFAQGYEIDPYYGRAAQELWASAGLHLDLADFTKATPPPERFSLLICNPPYVRHHHLDAFEKLRLHDEAAAAAKIPLSGLAGLYCYFLALSHRWMNPGAFAGWLIPSEFMDVNYGRELKRYLLNEVTLLRIHRFDPQDVQFGDALVSSVVVWLKNERPARDHTVEFTYGGTHTAPALQCRIAIADLAREAKWTRFPKKEVRVIGETTVLADLFDIKRGIATGSNSFFILGEEKIDKLGLPRAFFRPILPSPRYVEVDEITTDERGNPVLPQRLFLLDCKLPEHVVQREHPSLWAYLQSGKEELAARYLCKTRRVWYWQEERPATPFLCTYMGRGNGRRQQPFRFLLNHSRATAANTYLLLYPKPHMARQLEGNPSLLKAIWQALNEISSDSLITEGRIYGGGLHKIEPKELGNLPAKHIEDLLILSKGHIQPLRLPL